ncbi:MAG: DUF3014 domain-containing protein [Piscinibacter sp.]|nr:DUF3014 domain-containing protein [Piscinibacter sp.]
MNPRYLAGGIAVLVLAGAAGGYYAWRLRALAPPPVAAVAPADAPPAAEPADAAPSAPAVRHPIETLPALPDPAAAPPATAADGFDGELHALLGERTARGLLQGDGPIARIVATVDNLGREHATPRLWPVNPTGGRFTTQRVGDQEAIAPSNAARYQAFVRLVESVDTTRVVALYVRFYPQFQQAYAALGFPRVYFNDRLVEVIDLLLATPQPRGPVAVRLVEIKGPVESTRPWTRYEFADPALEALPAGQKIMLRLGSDNAQRLKAKLAEFRRALVAGVPR